MPDELPALVHMAYPDDPYTLCARVIRTLHTSESVTTDQDDTTCTACNAEIAAILADAERQE